MEIAGGATEARLDDGLDVVRAVEFSPDCSKLFAVDEVGQLHVWETEDWRRAHREHLDNEKFFALAISGDGARVAAAGPADADRFLGRVDDAEFGHTRFSDGGHREWVQSLDFSAADGTLALGRQGRCDSTLGAW